MESHEHIEVDNTFVRSKVITSAGLMALPGALIVACSMLWRFIASHVGPLQPVGGPSFNAQNFARSWRFSDQVGAIGFWAMAIGAAIGATVGIVRTRDERSESDLGLEMHMPEPVKPKRHPAVANAVYDGRVRPFGENLAKSDGVVEL